MRPSLSPLPAISIDIHLSPSILLVPPSPNNPGLDPPQFQSLLLSSRERHFPVPKKRLDLRKEVAIKVHKSKQEERRARFLAKIGAPPSPTAIDLPVTPPESPALFHFTLPSPGLVSPLALFESLSEHDPRNDDHCPWVEQVEFHLSKADPKAMPVPSLAKRRPPSLPSLDELSAHMRLPPPVVHSCATRPPLPAFLKSKSPSSSGTIVALEEANRLCIKTSVVPRSSSSSPMALTEANLLAFERRARASSGLLTLKRRLSPDAILRSFPTLEDKRLRRFSAPPELPLRDDGRLPGGF